MTSIDNASDILKSAIADVLPGTVSFSEIPAEGLSDRELGRIRLAVARRLFSRPFRSQAELKALLDRRKGEDGITEIDILNFHMLPLDGIGENSFYINEHFDDDAKRSGIATLREYDESAFLRRETYRCEITGEVPRPYVGALDGDQVWWLDGDMVYGTVSMANRDLDAEVEEFILETIRSRYVTRHVPGPRHGLVENGFRIWEMTPEPKDADVRRTVAQDVMLRFKNGMVDGEWGRLLAGSGPWAMREPSVTEGERDEFVVLSGPEAADRLRVRHWLADLSALPDGTDAYGRIAAAALEETAAMLEEVFDVIDACEADDEDVLLSTVDAALSGESRTASVS